MSYGVSTTEYKKKGFFSKPEGVTGMILLAGAGVGLFMAWGAIVPFILATAASTLGLVCILGVLGFIAYCVTNPQVRTGFFYLFKTLCRMFTGWVIELDPIAILKSHVVDLKKQKALADEEITKVIGAEEELTAKMRENIKTMEKTKREYEVSIQRGLSPEDIEHLKIRMGGLDQMNKNLAPLQNNLVYIHEHLMRISKASGNYILQIQETVTLKEIEFKAIRAASRAMKSAMSIFKGDPDKQDMFEQTMEYITADVATKVGEIKMAIESSSEYLMKMDIQNGVMAEDGMDIMNNFNPSNYSLMTIDQVANDRKQKKISAPTVSESNEVFVAEPVKVTLSKYKK